MFRKIADFVGKRYKTIIVAWLIILCVMVPFAPKVMDIVKYEETQMAPTDIESEVAQRFLDANFPSASGQSSTIIVITSDDVLSNDTKKVVFEIDNALFNETHAGGRIDGNVTVDSIYSATTSYVTGLLLQLNAAYFQTRNMANLTAMALFDLPLGFQGLQQNATGAAFIIYGIPAIHLQVWAQVNATMPPGTPIPTIDAAAYSQTITVLDSDPYIQAMNQTQRELAVAWFSSYLGMPGGWNATASSPQAADPQLRAASALSTTFPTFVDNTPLPTEQKVFLTAVYGGLDLLTWSDYHSINAVCNALFGAQIDGMIGGVTEAETQLVHLYFDTFYSGWNATASPPNQTAFRSTVAATVNTVAAIVGGEEGSFLLAVHDGIGWSGWNDLDVISVFTANMVAQGANVRPWVVTEVSGIPPTASITRFDALAKAIVSNSSFHDFPVPVIPALLNSFVNAPANTTMIISLSFDSGSANTSLGQASVEAVRDVVHSAVGGVTGLTSYVTGNDAISADMQTSTMGDVERIDPVTIVLILVLIGLFFRSFVASSIPPAVIGVALGMSFAIVFFIGSGLIMVHYAVPVFMLVSMMGAGCDYCIFVLSRYREERHQGLAKAEAVHTAVTWAGESIATSGATVIIGFGVLSVGRFDMLKSMGIGLAVGVTIALLAALLLLPAILMLVGDRIFWPSKLDREERERRRQAKERKRTEMQAERARRREGKEGYFTKAAKFSIKHAKAVVVVALLVSVPATYAVFTLETSYDFIGAMPDIESKQGLTVLGDSFGAGKMTPTYLALNMSSPVAIGDTFNITELNSIENLSAQLLALDNVKQVISPTRPLGEADPIGYANLSVYPAEEQAQYLALMRGMMGTTNSRAVMITIIFQAEPFAKASIDSIQSIRALAGQWNAADPAVSAAMVAGGTASMYDISNMVQTDFNFMEILVVIGIYLVLMVVLGSLINPLRSILTILLSISWTLAVTMLLFQFMQGIAILWMVPMILLVICLGLGMDYDIFITTRIRENAQKGMSDKDAIVHAMERTGGIITACGIIMAGAFGTMLLSSGALLREFGFALMFAILLDATVVRIYLVPAIMSLLGKWNWYAPGRLQRVKRDQQSVQNGGTAIDSEVGQKPPGQ